MNGWMDAENLNYETVDKHKGVYTMVTYFQPDQMLIYLLSLLSSLYLSEKYRAF